MSAALLVFEKFLGCLRAEVDSLLKRTYNELLIPPGLHPVNLGTIITFLALAKLPSLLICVFGPLEFFEVLREWSTE